MVGLKLARRETSGRARAPSRVEPWSKVAARLCCAGLFPLAASPGALAAQGQPVAGNTPAFVAGAAKAGRVGSGDVLTVSLWLRPHGQAAMDALAADLYNPASPNYRRWLKHDEIVARFMPTAAEAATVESFLRAQGLTVTGEGPDHFFVRAQGTVAAIEKAFGVTLSTYVVGRQTFRANDRDPVITGPAAALVQVVSGLDDVRFTRTAGLQPASSAAATSAPADGAHAAAAPSGFSASCFLPPATQTVGTKGGPKASYSGIVYQTAKAGCGYTPADVYAAYNLGALYSQGLDGAGQTITLIEPCGSPTLTSDANGFSKGFGLPALTSANFAIVHYPGPSVCAGYDPSATGDLEWSHAVAPGANIVVLVPPSDNVDDIDAATFYAVNSGVPQVINGSYAQPEYLVGAAEAKKENLISEIGAISGIATNYASGDQGDYSYTGFVPRCASVPADLPFATGVGGVSLALNTDGSVAFQTAWETHVAELVAGGDIVDPPHEPQLPLLGFVGGSGGEFSVYFASPGFQSSLNRHRRAVPDIAWLGDPQTGGLILISQANVYPHQHWIAYGGTELASAMFSGLWAIAGQAAGMPLGQAAPYLYKMPAGLITDIVPTSSAHDVRATITTAPGSTTSFTPAQIFAEPNSTFGPFISALAVEPGGTIDAISFGQDFYVHPGIGWDQATGLGVPNAAAFVASFLPAASAAK